MRIFSRLILVLVAIVVLGLITLVVALPRLAATDQVRDAIEQASLGALGRPLQYGELSVGILPPRIELASPRIAGATATAKPLFAAERVDLRIALLPLLGLVVVVDSLEIDGVEIEVIRTADGFELPMPPPAPPPTGAGEAASDEGSGGVSMAIRSVRVTNGRVSIVDRSVTPSTTVALDSIEVSVRGVHPAEPIRFDGRAALTTGGEISFDGSATLEGVLDLVMRMQEIVIAPFGVYAGQDVSLDGTASGEIVVKGPSAAPESLTLALNVDLIRARSGDAVIEGPVIIGAELRGDPARPTGSFSIDATGARVTSSDSFDKPRGIAARGSGKFATGKADALDVTLERVELASLLAHGRVGVGEKTVITLDADSFEFAELRKLLPFTEGTEMTGVASIHDWRVQVEPLSLAGELVVESARLKLTGGGIVDIKGRVVGKGSGLDFVDFDVSAGDQHIALSGKIRELGGRAPFSIKLDSAGVLQANPLLTGLDPSLANRIYGPMTLTGAVSGVMLPGTEERDILDLLDGQLQLDMGRTVGSKNEGGRIVGFSALGSVAVRLEQLGEMARITSIMLGGNPPELSAFTGEAFDSLEVRLRVHEGVLDTDHLRIVYANHSVDLRGSIALSTLALDMNGEVLLGSAVAAALGAKAKDGEIVVRLAHVGGTLDDPKVEVSKTAIASLTSLILTNNATVKSTLESAEQIAPGSGRLLEKALEGVMGAGKKKE